MVRGDGGRRARGRGLPRPVDAGLQPERTALAWERTGLSLMVAALGVGRNALGPLGLAVALPCVAVLACALWLRIQQGRRTRYARAHAREPGFVVLHDGRPMALVATLIGMLCLVEFVAALVT